MVSCALWHSPAHAETLLQVSTGAQYSDGAYGEAVNTRALVVPFSTRLGFGSWSLQASVPYVRVRGPENLGELLDDSGGRGSNSGSGSSGSDDDAIEEDDDLDDDEVLFDDDREVSGIGDTSIAVTYSFEPLAGRRTYVDLTGRMRLPTGDEADGLGVGATDYFLLAELGYAGRRGGAYLSGGRRFLGDNGLNTRVDGWQAAAGAWMRTSAHLTWGLNYDWRDASVPAATAPSFLEAYVAWRINDVWKLEFNGGTGLSTASADYAAGFTVSWRSVPGRRRSN